MDWFVHMTKYGAKRIYCDVCNRFFYNKDNYNKHKEECKTTPAFMHLLMKL